jgi:hypothetical protein
MTATSTETVRKENVLDHPTPDATSLGRDEPWNQGDVAAFQH